MLFEETPIGYLMELVWRIHFLSKRAMDRDLKKLGLTYPQFGTLKALSIKENISQKQLALFLETDTTNVMVICDSLEKKKLIERKANPNDRRENLIARTELGKKRFKKAMLEMEAKTGAIAGQLRASEISAVLPQLEKILDFLKGDRT